MHIKFLVDQGTNIPLIHKTTANPELEGRIISWRRGSRTEESSPAAHRKLWRIEVKMQKTRRRWSLCHLSFSSGITGTPISPPRQQRTQGPMHMLVFCFFPYLRSHHPLEHEPCPQSYHSQIDFGSKPPSHNTPFHVLWFPSTPVWMFGPFPRNDYSLSVEYEHIFKNQLKVKYEKNLHKNLESRWPHACC